VREEEAHKINKYIQTSCLQKWVWKIDTVSSHLKSQEWGVRSISESTTQRRR
jgi:hypothetical protein